MRINHITIGVSIIWIIAFVIKVNSGCVSNSGFGDPNSNQTLKNNHFGEQDTLPAICKEWKITGTREGGGGVEFYKTSGKTLKISCDGKYSVITPWDTVIGTWEVWNYEIDFSRGLNGRGIWKINLLSNRTLILSTIGRHGPLYEKYEAEMLIRPESILDHEK